MLVIDACLALEYLLKTPLGIQGAAVVELQQLACPELLDAEVFAVLRRQVLRGEVTTERAQQVLDDLQLWDLERIPHRALLERAWQARHNVGGYDAFYVAAAALLDVPVVTIDGPLSRSPSTGVTVINVSNNSRG